MSYDPTEWPIEKLRYELDKAHDDLREDREYQESLPSGARDYSVLESDRQWIRRLEAELDRRGWK